MSAPSDRGWHSTTLLQGGGNQQAHGTDAPPPPASHGTDHHQGQRTGHGQGQGKGRGKGKGKGQGEGVDGGMWWLNKCDGNVIVVFGGLRWVGVGRYVGR